MNDKELLSQIKDLDLIAKEFKFHLQPCYRYFTRENKKIEKPLIYDKGDFQSVLNCINENIIRHHQAVYLLALHEIFGLNPGDRRYRKNLKLRIEDHFKEEVMFLSSPSSSQYILVGKNTFDSNPMTCLSVDENIRYVAEYLKSEIIKQSKDLPEVGWPATFDELSDVRLKSPECVTTFLQFLLQKNSTDYPNTNRLVNSFAQDLVRGVTNGKIILAKHFLIALGLHNMTGQKQVVDILHRLGHCISYSQMCEIETAQAEAAIERSMSSSILSLKPPQNSDGVIFMS